MDIYDQLDEKHKKEKKELQAKIQALKKLAKNDKSKKKEINAEIARLEFELDDQQKLEIDNANIEKNKESSQDVPILEPPNDSKTKITKAQKRRDKKAQEERDRAERILLQERENIDGPRNTEMKAINTRLQDRGLRLYTVASDGDCLYKAVAHQLDLTGRDTQSVEELRKKAANFIRENKEDFMPFMSNPDTLDMLKDSEFEEYCHNVANTKSWGGQIEIRALSSSLKCPIQVVQATGPEVIVQGEEFDSPPLIISYHRHMFKLGEHYNSTQKRKDDEEIDETE